MSRSGETALTAVVREMAEEGGVAATAAPKLIGFYANHIYFPNDHIAVYRFDEWKPCKPAEDGEIAERAFFALDALPDGVSRGTRRRLAEAFGGAEIAAEW